MAFTEHSTMGNLLFNKGAAELLEKHPQKDSFLRSSPI